MSGEYERALRHAVPHAEICFDPFHVIRVGADAVDQVRRDEWNAHERSHTATGRWVKHTRWALLKAPDRQNLHQLGTLGEVYARNQRLYRAFLLDHQTCGCSTTSRTPRSRPRTSTPGCTGPRAPSSHRSSRPPAPCAATATASAPRSASDCPTAASRASTAACGSSATAASAFTPPHH